MNMQSVPARRARHGWPGGWLLAGLGLAIILGLQFVGSAPTRAVANDTGYVDFSYGPGLTPVCSSAFSDLGPTGEKPQSKLWFNDGFWWGVLLNGTTQVYDIYKFNWQSQTWADTGTLVDSRSTSHADALWYAPSNYLYIATAVPPGDSGNTAIHVLRYTYSTTTQTYTLAADMVPATGGVEAVVLDKDSTGVVWVSYTLDTSQTTRAVYVTHNMSGGGFIPPYIIPVTGAANLTSDDISAIVAYNGKIGVMWSNQRDDAVYFAVHVDGAPDSAWQGLAVYAGPHYPDDHINLKSLSADPAGQVFAAIKTSLSDVPTPDPNAPLIVLLVLPQNGAWYARTFSRVQDNETRPLVLIDTANRQLYMFASSNSGCDPSGIYYKQSNLDNVSFPAGLGTPFIVSGSHTNVNNATSTKQNLNGTTGLLVEASDQVTGYYLHNVINLPQPSATATNTVPPVPTATRTAPPTNTPVVPPSSTPRLTSTPSPLPSATARATTTSGVPTGTPLGGTRTSTAIPGPPTATATATPITSPTRTPTRVAGGTATRTALPGSATVTPVACATNFSDVHPADYFYTSVQYLACHGVISGYGDGTFRPYNQTTRGQMVKIVVLGFAKPIRTPAGGNATFADVPPSFPFFPYIETAAAGQIVSGYTCGGPGEPCDAQRRPYFRSYADVTRGQLSKIVVGAAGWSPVNPAVAHFTDVAPGTTFYSYVETVYCRGIVSGYTCGGLGEPCDPQGRPYFRPYSDAIRGQIAKIVYNSLFATACSGNAAGAP